jgi:two-component system, chemotaxis family, response regulator PixG
MTESSKSPKIPIREFIGTRQSNLFQTLKQPQFTGELILASAKGEQWTFYLYLGRIIYATGGRHPVRRWIRNVSRFAPVLITYLSLVDNSISQTKAFQVCWEYELLNYWLQTQEVTRQQLSQIIRSMIVEILFDVTQSMEIVFQLNVSQSLSTQILFIDADQVIVEAWEAWQEWQGGKLADRFPNDCPLIRQPDQLKQRTSEKTYQIMMKLFNGKNTLRDLSLQLNQDIMQMTRLMLPYIQLGLIDLVSIPDLPIPIKLSKK